MTVINHVDAQATSQANAQLGTEIDTQIDPATYDNVRPFFQRIMEQVLMAGRSVTDFVEFTIEKFGDAIIPYVKRFLAELEAGKVVLANFGETALAAIIGRDVTPDKRLQMIQEAAYYLAQKRLPMHEPALDWIEAEREIDARLAAQIGLYGHGRKAVVAVATAVEKEFTEVADSVAQWLSLHRPTGTSAH